MEVAEEHFQSIMSSPPLRQSDLNWPELNFQSHDLASLVEPFTEEELHKIVKQTPLDKAPGPDGFTGAFFKSCWPIIKGDILCAVQHFYGHRCTRLPSL